jgi:hypothetical protein
MRAFVAPSLILALGCGFLNGENDGAAGDDSAPRRDREGDADGDGDSDSDSDADGDGDADGDADADADADGDPAYDADCGPWAAIALGRSWTYEYDGSGGFTGGFGNEVAKLKNGKGEMANWGEYSTSGYTTDTDGTVDFVCDDGYRIAGSSSTSTTNGTRSSSTTTYDEPVLIIPASMKVGDEWTARFDWTTVVSGETYTGSYSQDYEVMARAEVSTEAGDFSALRVKITYDTGSTTSSTTAWYAEGYGLVAGDGYELVDYAF